MILRVDSDGAYLVAPKARSRAGGYHFLSGKEGSIHNAPVYNLAKVMKRACASAAEAEIGAACASAREAALFPQALEDMSHPGLPRPAPSLL